MITHDLALFGRVALAAVLGFVVGWEREVRGHPAGARTFALVAAGSAAFTVVAVDAFPLTAEKLIAGVATGIGFVGAGLVIPGPNKKVHGLTTAAAIWAVAAVGVIAGAARLLLATLVTVLYIVLLEGRALPVLKLLDARRWQHHFTKDTDGDGIPDSD